MLRGDFLHKAGGPVGAGAAKEHPLPGTGEVELFLGPCHSHITQPALLLHLLRFADGPNPGENPFLCPYYEDNGELQPLGRVHGHHHHTVLVGVMAVYIGVQSNLVQKAVQCVGQALL